MSLQREGSYQSMSINARGHSLAFRLQTRQPHRVDAEAFRARFGGSTKVVGT